MFERIKRTLIGKPRNVTDPGTYHSISLVAILAWVGLGADGLSSSSYGPDEAFRALGEHTYLAIGLALATATTVFIIASAYRGIIEHFPYGGGGYVVASQLLSPGFGVLSGSALLIDYVLTVAVSIASCADQIFSVLPVWMVPYKVAIEAFLIVVLVIMNLRGIKESILVLTPIFVTFLIVHVLLIVYGIGSHLNEVPRVAHEVQSGFQNGIQTLGLLGVGSLFLRAFSMGAGTFTGLEAVSNGLQIMRDPKVQTGKRTMLYMSLSLAITAGGIMVLYLLFNVKPEEGKTMNAVLLDNFAGSWRLGTLNIGHGYVVLTLAAEAALLFVAAQTGFIDGPRVMANMAIDGWLPRRYSQLSDRLTMQDGVLLMGGAALAVLFYTHGNITALVTMYSINVFLTFSLSMTGMCRYWIRDRHKQPKWKRSLAVQAIGLMLCVGILITVVCEKFLEGAWMTLVVTALLVSICFLIRRHYQNVGKSIRAIDSILGGLPQSGPLFEMSLDPRHPVAVMLVGAYSGLGVHQLLQVQKLFPGLFKSYVFISVGVVDSVTMKGIDEVDRTRQRTEDALKQYVALAGRLGFAAEYRMSMATEAVAESVNLCQEVGKQFPRAVFFMGKLVFEKEGWYNRFLHNETAYQLQHRLHFAGLNAIVLPVRLLEKLKKKLHPEPVKES
jgi:amino acid transporter